MKVIFIWNTSVLRHAVLYPRIFAVWLNQSSDYFATLIQEELKTEPAL